MSFIAKILAKVNFAQPLQQEAGDTVSDCMADEPQQVLVRPDSTRMVRLEKEIQLFVLRYSEFGESLQYLVLHGESRRKFGRTVAMPNVKIAGRRDDQIVAASVIAAKQVIHSLRSASVAVCH